MPETVPSHRTPQGVKEKAPRGRPPLADEWLEDAAIAQGLGLTRREQAVYIDAFWRDLGAGSVLLPLPGWAEELRAETPDPVEYAREVVRRMPPLSDWTPRQWRREAARRREAGNRLGARDVDALAAADAQELPHAVEALVRKLQQWDVKTRERTAAQSEPLKRLLPYVGASVSRRTRES